MKTGRREMAVLAALVLSLLTTLGAEAATKARTLIVLPYATIDLGREEQWIGEGVAQSLTIGFLQMPAVIQVDRERLKRVSRPRYLGRPDRRGCGPRPRSRCCGVRRGATLGGRSVHRAAQYRGEGRAE